MTNNIDTWSCPERNKPRPVRLTRLQRAILMFAPEKNAPLKKFRRKVRP